MENDNMALCPCPPYPEYKEQPKDQSKCKLVDCPRCDKKMWLSKKKQEMLVLSKKFKKNILLCCYNCMTKILIDNSDMLKEAPIIKL